MIIKNFIAQVALKLIGVKWITLGVEDFNEYSDKLILITLKKNGFIELNKRGEFYLKGFVLVEIIRDTIKNSLDKEIIVIKEIRIKHDIDSVTTYPSKGLILAGKFTSLQPMIDYFSKI